MLVWGRGYCGDVCLLKPKSRGRLRLKSADYRVAPEIDLNLLAAPDDQRTLIDGVHLLRRILSAAPFAHSGAEEVCPGPSCVDDQDVLAHIRSKLGTAFHTVGTCRMGAREDKNTVVDTDLKVIGLSNVRVVDASVMPEIVAGNTNAPTIMIAEVAADKILQQRLN